MTYKEYCEIQKAKKVQPMGEVAFNAMIAAGFCFKAGSFN